MTADEVEALPADDARCPGIGSDADGWYEECETCLRRTAPPNDVEPMTPPQIIVFSCEFYIPDEATK